MPLRRALFAAQGGSGGSGHLVPVRRAGGRAHAPGEGQLLLPAVMAALVFARAVKVCRRESWVSPTAWCWDVFLLPGSRGGLGICPVKWAELGPSSPTGKGVSGERARPQVPVLLQWAGWDSPGVPSPERGEPEHPAGMLGHGVAQDLPSPGSLSQHAWLQGGGQTLKDAHRNWLFVHLFRFT